MAVTNNASSNISILLEYGNGTFATAVNYKVGTVPVWIVANDFNNDDKQDLAVTNQNTGDVSVLLGEGDGSFIAARDYVIGI